LNGSRYGERVFDVLRSGHAGDGAHLGVTHLAKPKGLGNCRQTLDAVRDSHEKNAVE
jgi:hypothetical protein